MKRWASNCLSCGLAVVFLLLLAACQNENNDVPVTDTDQPTTDQPSTDQPSTDQPSTDEPTPDDPPATDDGDSTPPPAPQLSVSLKNNLDETVREVPSGEPITFTMTLLDDSLSPVVGQKVDFSASGGALSSTSRLTDESGTAVVVFDTTDLTPGVVVLGAVVVYEGQTFSENVEIDVLANEQPNQGALSLSMELEVDGESAIVIEEKASGQLRVRVVDADENPLPNTAVSFSVELGVLNSASDFTDDDGFAEVTLTGEEDKLGVSEATAFVTLNNVTYTTQLSYQVVESGAVSIPTTVSVGYFDDDGQFIDGRIKTDSDVTTISAGATLGLSLVLVNQDMERLTLPTSVSFTSTCVRAEQASIDTPVETVNGEATSTYNDERCASASGNTDDITATVVTGSETLTATTSIELLPEKLGSIEFVSSEPDSIVLKGTGGSGKQETAVVTFLVKGELGNPLRQQTVSFELNTTVGGLTLASESGVTDLEGKVSAKVIAGTVPTVVRVTAVAEGGDTRITTQSDRLSLNTGLPDQDSFSISLGVINLEAYDYDGVQTKINVYLADSFNNPVPDGTTVNFTTEGGSPNPSFCNTSQGSCSVTWSSHRSLPLDHRVTILATAEGHESFQDTDGNNEYSNDDGGSINDLFEEVGHESSSLNRVLAGFSDYSAITGEYNKLKEAGTTDKPFGYLDMPEAWRDDNENFVHDIGELFLDNSQDGSGGGSYSSRDQLFNGPQCERDEVSNSCSDQPFATLRKSVVLITSTSTAEFSLKNTRTGEIIRSSFGEPGSNSIHLHRDESVELQLSVCDTAFQVMPFETEITVIGDVGKLGGATELIVPSTVGGNASGVDINDCEPNGSKLPFTYTNTLSENDERVTGTMVLNIKTPRGVETAVAVNVTLESALQDAE